MTKEAKQERLLKQIELYGNAASVFSVLAVISLIIFAIIAVISSRYEWMVVGLISTLVWIIELYGCNIIRISKASKLLVVCEVDIEYDGEDKKYIEKAIRVLGL